MKKKISAISLIILLLISVFLPVTAGMKTVKNTENATDNNYNLMEQKICSESNPREWSEKTGPSGLSVSHLEPLDYLGYSVSIDGDYAIASAINDNEARGACYIFQRTNTGHWINRQKIIASNGIPYDRFGWSVCIKGDYAIIGAVPVGLSDFNNEPGKAYIFKRTGEIWTEEEILTAPDGKSRDQFGCSVSIDGDYAVIGAKWIDNYPKKGAVYVFEKTESGWIQKQKLTTPDGGSPDGFFGNSVSINRNYIIVGSNFENREYNEYKGAAYIFRLETKEGQQQWVLDEKIAASDGGVGHGFGLSVDIDGVYAFISSNIGAVYVFKYTGRNWTEEQKFYQPPLYHFGFSVSIDGGFAIIGAYGDDHGHINGAAYIYRLTNDGWIQHQKITVETVDCIDRYGWSASISGKKAIVGAIRFSPDANGAAFVFEEDTYPNPPTITGPNNIEETEPELKYEFTLKAIDPEGEDIYYYIDWGDGTNTIDWIGPYKSGTEVKINHSWISIGNYDIKAKARDTNYAESDWANLGFTVSKNIASHNQFFRRIFEKWNMLINNKFGSIIRNKIEEQTKILSLTADEDKKNDTLIYDLEAVSISVSPSSFDKGERVTITMTVHNAADVINHWFKITLYFDGNWWGDHVIDILANDSWTIYRPAAYNREGKLVGPLYIYDTDSVSRDFYWPDDYNNHSLQMFCDSTKRYDEINESNNWASLVLKAEKPDIARSIPRIFNGKIYNLLVRLFSLKIFNYF